MRFIFYLIYLYYQKELILFLNTVPHCQYFIIAYCFDLRPNFNFSLMIYSSMKIMKSLLVLMFLFILEKSIFLYQD